MLIRSDGTGKWSFLVFDVKAGRKFCLFFLHVG